MQLVYPGTNGVAFVTTSAPMFVSIIEARKEVVTMEHLLDPEAQLLVSEGKLVGHADLKLVRSLEPAAR